jgi:hypothetical protein
MSLSILLGFTFVLTLSRTQPPPPPSLPNGYNNNGFQQLRERNNYVPVQQQRDNTNEIMRARGGIGGHLPGGGDAVVGPGGGLPVLPPYNSRELKGTPSQAAFRRNKYDWRLPKASSTALPTVPGVLKPDYGDLPTEGGRKSVGEGEAIEVC